MHNDISFMARSCSYVTFILPCLMVTSALADIHLTTTNLSTTDTFDRNADYLALATIYPSLA